MSENDNIPHQEEGVIPKQKNDPELAKYLEQRGRPRGMERQLPSFSDDAFQRIYELHAGVWDKKLYFGCFDPYVGEELRTGHVIKIRAYSPTWIAKHNRQQEKEIKEAREEGLGVLVLWHDPNHRYDVDVLHFKDGRKSLLEDLFTLDPAGRMIVGALSPRRYVDTVHTESKKSFVASVSPKSKAVPTERVRERLWKRIEAVEEIIKGSFEELPFDDPYRPKSDGRCPPVCRGR